MRLIVVAGLCLLALPAQAQRVNTRMTDIVQMADGRQHCRFQAVPDMRMTEAHRGGKDARAEWAHKARDGDAWLHARFQPEEPKQQILMIEVPLTPAIAKAVSVEVSLDAEASPVAFDLKRTWSGSDRWTLVPRDGAALAEAMRYTDLLGVRLRNRAGKRLASYEFWIGNLQDVGEIPFIVEWQCRSFP